FSNREPRANVVFAANASRTLLRHCRAGCHHPTWTDCRQHGSSLFKAAAGTRSCDLSASGARVGPQTDFGRTAVSGTAAANGDDHGRIQRGEAEELRRAFGFKRSERRMKEVEVKLRQGMNQNGITGEVQDQIIHSITS